jgi:NitT/TauT family transport system substrate-binding protein
MRTQHAQPFSQRRFLQGMRLAGTVGFLGLHFRAMAAEPPPETTLRLVYSPSICIAPSYVAADLLAGEGFTDVQHVKTEGQLFTTALLARADWACGGHQCRGPAAVPVLLLHGLHARGVHPEVPSGHETGVARHHESR